MPTDTSDLRDVELPRRAPAGGRSRALLVGAVAAVVALVAAVVAGVVASRLTDDEDQVLPEAEAEIRFLPEDDESGQPLVGDDRTGDPAPEAAFPLLDGGLGTLTDLRGTPVVVNFFASWCEPCKAEMPDFAEVHAEVGDEVAFLGISLRDAEEDTRALLERTGVAYAIGRDPSGSLAEDFGVVNMPTTYFLDAAGDIFSTHAGALTADALRSQLAALTS
jgi:thiol-disulfide isomerase/thioredoxin